MMSALWQDLRYGVRMLVKNRATSCVAIVALALGIGANTAIFSVVNAVLLQPLPYPAPDRLVSVGSANARGGDGQFGGVSPADFLDWAAQSRSFEALAAYRGDGVTLTGTDLPEQFQGASVSDGFFRVLGVQPVLGRWFLPEEHAAAGGSNRAVILSHRLWQRRFGSDPGIIGKTLTLSGERQTIVVGVMPPDFRQPVFAEVWTPLLRDSGEMVARGSRYLSATARLRPGVTLREAQAEMTILANLLEKQYPETNTNWGVRLVPLQESLVKNARVTLLLLLGAVGFD